MREDKPMAYISFIAVLFGAAGIVGGIESGNTNGTIAMTVAARKEEPEEEDGGD